MFSPVQPHGVPRLRLVCLGALLTVANPAGAQTVNAWLTTADQQSKLQPQAALAFTAAAAAGNPVVVDETQTYQQIEGFGASFTDTSAYLLNEVVPAGARPGVMADLFTRTVNGIGLSFVRNPMGASDFARSVYSYDDQTGSATDPSLAGFSIQHDLADIVPLVQQALQLNPQLKIMANPWSPPGWMKTSGSMITGSLRADMYAPFANYFVKYIQAYAANGIPIHYLSLQNEPLYGPTSYPGMLMDAATQTTVLRDYVLPALTANQLSTKVLVYDHNWDRPDFPDQVLADSVVGASSQVAGIAWHGYGGTPGAMTTLAAKYPAKGNYVTEHSGGTWVANQLQADFEEITQVMRNWGRAYVKWNLALDQNRGPTFGGASTCYPLVTVNSVSGAATYTVEYYTLGHFSKFVLPGASRVYSTNGAGVVSAAFVNPDGSKVLVAYNDSTVSQTFQVRWGARQFAYTLAASAAATFTWSGSPAGGYTLDPTLPIRASSFNATRGLQTETTTDTLGGYDVGYSDNTDYAVYKNVDFGSGVNAVTARVASASTGGTLELRLDSPAGLRVASLAIGGTGGWQTWQNVTGSVAGATGVHDVYLVFVGGAGIANLNWFQFAWTSLAPRIASSLPNQTVTAGNPAVFTVAAGGTPAPTLQWQRLPAAGGGWVNLADSGNFAGTATATLTVSGTATGMSGDQFRCVATNPAGSATSNAAALTVNPAPILNAIAYNATTFPATALPGATVAFTYNVTNAGTNAWGANHSLVLRDANNHDLASASLNGVAPGASSTATLSFIAPALPGQDVYYVQGLEQGVGYFSARATVALLVSSVVGPADFNGDGHADLLWQNRVTGERAVWLMNNGTYLGSVPLGTVPAAWSIAGTGDFNGDGHPDLVWQNSGTGERLIWLMNGGAFASSVSLGVVSTDWSIAAVGDFNGDGRPDLVWQNAGTGERLLWLMSGTTFLSSASLGTVPTAWSIAGTGDFNADGHPDLVWQNLVTGECALWLMNGPRFASAVSLGSVPPPLLVAGTTDFDGDGQTDILWTNTLTGERTVWLMNGATHANTVSLGTVPLEWTLGRPSLRRPPADFNGDGQSDLIWQNTVTGERLVWLMTGTSFLSGVSLGAVSTDWSIAGNGDFNGDGHPDLVWQNDVTGERLIWLLDGAVFQGAVSLGAIPTAWTIAGTGDFNGDGQADLIWQNNSTGERIIWLMSGPAYLGSVYLGVVPTNWTLAGSGDFNGDGSSDLLWQNTATGERVIWLMTGPAFASSVDLGAVPIEWTIATVGDFNGDGQTDIVWQNSVTGERVIWLMTGTNFLSSVSLGAIPVEWSVVR